MGSLFRSQPMLLVNIFMSHDAVHTVVDELARIGAVQFRDLNPGVNAFHRNFVNDVRRIDEMEKKLTIFQQKMTEHNVRTDFYYPHANLDADDDFKEETHLTVLASLENQFEELVHELQQLDQYQTATRRDITSAIEERNVLERAHNRWLEGSERFVLEAGADEDEEIHLLGGEQRSTNLSFVAGVIDRPSLSSFRRVLWRVTHGNLFMHDDDIAEPIPHPKTNKPIDKTAFIIFTQGEVAQNKIRKICEAFSASLFPISPNPRAREQHITELTARIDNLRRVFDVNTRRTREILTQIEPLFDGWRCRILKEKLIFHTMNLFDYDIQRKTLIAEGWVPEKRLAEVQESLETASAKCRALVAPVLHVVTDTQEVPPTFFETNKYTVAFQNIIDAYGVPDYQEVNPASFTIISFPFLFGVMFGDLGHGTFLLMFALYLILNERALGATRLNEIIKMCFDGRYVLILMGVFAMYVGFLYNECFAVPMNFFGVTFFEFGGENTYLKPYPVGVNPVWKVADNTLLYYNSLKMKMSIVIGVFHMTFGIILSAFNGTFFRKHWEHKYDIWAVFIPQLIFFLAIFGYMTWLIIFKWCVNWMNIEGFQAPKLLTVMIAMFQQIGSLNPDYYMFYGQHGIQVFLVIIALICVPWMLLPKPFLLRRDWRNAHPDWREREAAKARGEEYHAVGDADEPGPIVLPSKIKNVDGAQYTHLPNDFDDSDDDHHHDRATVDETVVPVAQHSGAHHHEEEFDFGEIFVHQMIHTIEFVLGAISNTASYLRLWALSLAHSELAEVFLDRVALLSLKYNFALSPWIGFGAWAGLTWAVLLGMESISAFLHALRLHWVEFMNKFYHGSGHPFEPVSHSKTLITQESD